MLKFSLSLKQEEYKNRHLKFSNANSYWKKGASGGPTGTWLTEEDVVSPAADVAVLVSLCPGRHLPPPGLGLLTLHLPLY